MPNGATPYPLVVFGPGFDLRPSDYSTLLESWARFGYVVAAPAFPLTNPSTPGGPDERDIVNQPQDMRLVITTLIRLDHRPASALFGRINVSKIAVAGHSDGGATALAVAYSSCCRDARVRAAVILSGAMLSLGEGPAFTKTGPPLLAVQGLADDVNRPASTADYFSEAPTPKYLLWLKGANHLAPYTAATAYERVVAQVALSFLNRYLNGAPSEPRLPTGGRRLATLRADLS